MAHIKVPGNLPGILGPMAFNPKTAKPLNALAEMLLRGPNSLPPADREMIATYVSSQNDCYFCQHAHGAVMAYRLGGDEKLVNDVKLNFESARISDKMKALLALAGKVQKGGKQVTTSDVDRARQHGATDKEIHDTVLIAAAFCMYNRTLTAWQLGLLVIQTCIARMAGVWLKRATSSQPRNYQQSRKNMHSRRLKLTPFAQKLLVRLLFVLMIAYLSFGTLVWWAMHQPPETFGRVMARMPGPAPFLIFPFETAWLHARAGTLHVGDPAPDFSLLKLDKSERVQLSLLSQQLPVVLVFGSYT